MLFAPWLLALLTPPQLVATEEQKLIPANNASGDQFGWAIALDGDRALIGINSISYGSPNFAGSAYVFERGAGAWAEVAELQPSDPVLNDYFGEAVDLDGDTAVVGRWADDTLGKLAGAAHVFRRIAGTWVEVQKLYARADGEPSDGFGHAVAIEGDTIAIGAPWEDDWGSSSGAVYVFAESGGKWKERAKLVASDAGPDGHFGSAVDLDGGTLLVGSPRHSHGGGLAGGAAYVFAGSGGVWTEQGELTDPALEDLDFMGYDVALSGDRALVGALRRDHPLVPDAGAAYVFSRAGTTWTQEQLLYAAVPIKDEHFGLYVALDGDLAVVSAVGADDVSPGNRFCDSGAAYLFTRTQAGWVQHDRLLSSDIECDDYFGESVALQGDTVFVGATREDTNGWRSGATYVFSVAPAPSAAYCTAGTSGVGCAATLQASGAGSATAASGLVLTASSADGAAPGIFFFGANGRQANPWGNGTSYQCVVPPVQRAGAVLSSGTAGACDGTFVQDLNALWCPACPKPHLNPGFGATVQVQLWYLDPASTSNQAASLSNAVELTLGF